MTPSNALLRPACPLPDLHVLTHTSDLPRPVQLPSTLAGSVLTPPLVICVPAAEVTQNLHIQRL